MLLFFEREAEGGWEGRWDVFVGLWRLGRGVGWLASGF